MADDIDIEEHDVLESLRRRQAPEASLPDAALVKTEPEEPDYNDSHYDDPANYNWEWQHDQPPIKVEPHTEDDAPFGRIILGSKPATPPPQENPPDLQDRQESYNYNMSLVLDDWGPTLENSDCYCKECQILFATVNALDAHKMIAHSFLVATDKQASPERNKAIKSTAKSSYGDNRTCEICQYQFIGTTGKYNLLRHYREVHKVDPSIVQNKKDFKSWRVCNHCNKYFPDDTSLVKHLYELLPLNNKTPTKDDKKTGKVSAEKVKPVSNVDKVDPKPTVSKDIKSTNAVAEVKPVKVTKLNSTLNKNANRIILGSKTVENEPGGYSDKTKTWKCDICDIAYNRKYYLIHMKRYHHDVNVKKLHNTPRKDISVNIKSPDKVLLSNCNVRFKCTICNEILTSYYMCRKHKKKHPATYGKKIIVKLVKTGKTQNDKPVATKTELAQYKGKSSKKETSEDTNDILVSKSTIFKCNRCSVHFLTCTGACQHSIICESSTNIRDWACPQCQKVFRSVERTAHLYQHKFMNTKFKVYVVYLEMIVRVLCECPDCYVCFEEDKFWRHASGGCKNDAASYFCNECRLPIDVFSKANHDSKHKQGDFTKDDFIKIDYVSFKKKVPMKTETEMVEQLKSPANMLNTAEETPKKALKRKLEMEEAPAKKLKSCNADEFHLFFCSNCKNYLARKVSYHVNGLCKRDPKKYSSICKYCGLYISSTYSKTHLALHERLPHLTLSDFTFTRISDSKKIKPQPVTYPCKACDVNFQSKWARHCHKCRETPSVYCQVCQKKIQKIVFKIHMQFHNYVIPSQTKLNNQKSERNNPSPSSLSEDDDETPMRKMPDLLTKYQSLTALWNILYLCATCDTFTDSYDKVVEHCQNHLTNMENYGVVIMKCQICNMKFDSECYRRHLELHAGSKVITKKTFQILKYEYYNLFTANWFDFINVPEEQKSQIVGRSIYGENRCVKMRLIQQGPPEYTLYKCCKCMNCVRPDTIVHHVKLANCLKANKLTCSICDMTFAIRSQCEEHEQIHEATGLGLESFRIVVFNDTNDMDSNIKIMSYDTENHGSKNRVSFTDEEVLSKDPVLSKNIPKSKSFVFYKCAECHVCQMHLKNLKKHACSNSKKKVCGKCGLLYNAIYLRLHLKLHDRYKISRNNVVVKTVNKEGQVINIKKQIHEKTIVGSPPKLNDNMDENPKLYKCYCGLHYTSLKTIEKHYKMKNCGTIVREKCSQCHLMFDPIEVVNHLCKHHAKNQNKSFDIVTPNKKTLFKCSLCHVLFDTKNTAIQHKSKCVGKFSGKKCEKCGLAFDVTSLLTHLIDHERNNKLRNDCYVIVKIPDDNVPLKKIIHKTPDRLFKCYKCDVHFSKRDTLQSHIKKHVNGIVKMNKIETCQRCGLKFSPKTLHWHIRFQHNKLNITDFDVKVLGADGKIVIPKVTEEGKQPTISKPTTKPKVNKQIESASPKVTPVVKVEPKPVERNVTVYKCVKCALHFTDEASLVTHYEDRCSKELTENCDECDVKFATKNIKEHKNQHQTGVTLIMNIKAEAKPFVRPSALREYRVKKAADPLDKYDNKLYKCTECNFHYNSKNTILKHLPDLCRPDAIPTKCDICDIGFTKHSLHRHTLIHEKYDFKKDDFVILTLADLDDSKLKNQDPDDSQADIDEDIDVDVASLDTSTESETAEKEDTNMKIKVERKDNAHLLYKCADCNLYFVTPRACHKHIVNHTPLDSKNYIECKLCGFQFTIMALQTHIKKHHAKQFDLEEVLVEEYQPNDIKTSERYYASEKTQCLVSTSEDVRNISNSQVENDNEVTSCCEVEKVESSERNDAQSVDIDDKNNKVCDEEINTVLEVATETKSNVNEGPGPLPE